MGFGITGYGVGGGSQTPTGNGDLVKLDAVSIGSPASIIDFSDIPSPNNYSAFLIIFKLKNDTTSGADIHLYFNEDYTDAHYYSQRNYASNTTIAGARSNAPVIAGMNNTDDVCGHIWIFKNVAGYGCAVSQSTNRNGANIILDNYGTSKSDATLSSITDIRIKGGQNFETGSVAYLYGLVVD